MMLGTTSASISSTLNGSNSVQVCDKDNNDHKKDDDIGPAPGPRALSSITLAAKPRE